MFSGDEMQPSERYGSSTLRNISSTAGSPICGKSIMKLRRSLGDEALSGIEFGCLLILVLEIPNQDGLTPSCKTIRSARNLRPHTRNGQRIR